MPDANDRVVRRSPLAMAVLLLLQHEPMHPYGLRQRIVEWDKDRVINVSQRNAVYQTIDRLERRGLLALRERAQQERRPDRQIYQATEEGAQLARRWLLELLATPTQEYPSFPAALAFIQSVDRPAATAALERRAELLAQQIAQLETQVKEALDRFPGEVDQIYLLEIEYLTAIWRAELRWVRRTVEKLRSGTLGATLADGAAAPGHARSDGRRVAKSRTARERGTGGAVPEVPRSGRRVR